MSLDPASQPPGAAAVQMIVQPDGSYVTAQPSSQVVLDGTATAASSQPGAVYPAASPYVDPSNPQVVYQAHYPVSCYRFSKQMIVD